MINVIELPFVKLVGLSEAETDSNNLAVLPSDSHYGNHIGSVHAGALMTLAETASGVFLERNMADLTGFVAVVRRFEAKFIKPAYGSIKANCPTAMAELNAWRSELVQRGRLLMMLPIILIDENRNIVMKAEIEWFITRQKN